MLQRIKAYVEKNHMIEPHDRVVVGCSGGADSMSLLLLMDELKEALSFSLLVLHVEHGIRGEESKGDAAFVRQFCKEREIPFVEKEVDAIGFAKKKQLGLEEAARILRYEAFESIVDAEANLMETEGKVKVALAHHMEDNAETILFQMTRGSGIQGLTGMQAIRSGKKVTYIRPLLCVSRAEIEDFLEQRHQDFCTDSTNWDDSYSRNRIRHQVLPELMKVNAQAVSHINATAMRLAQIWEYLDLEAEELSHKLFRQEENGISFCYEEVIKLPEALKQELVRRAIFMASGKKKDIGASHVASVIGLCNKQSGKRLHLPYGVLCYVEYNRLFLVQNEGEEKSKLSCHIGEEIIQKLKTTGSIYALCQEADAGAFFANQEEALAAAEKGKGYFYFSVVENNLGDQVFEKKAYTKYLDYDKIKGGFWVRSRRSKDYIIQDLQGHRKKLSNYFIDEKIPSAMRDTIPLCAIDSEILWVVGGRMGENYKVRNDSRMILKIIYNGGN